MTTEHTSGPWNYKKDGFKITIGNESTRHNYLKHNYTVATIDDNSCQAETNARLIAAAPDYDDAAKWAESILTAYLEADSQEERDHYWKDLEHARNRLRAAIAKAEGKDK